MTNNKRSSNSTNHNSNTTTSSSSGRRSSSRRRIRKILPPLLTLLGLYLFGSAFFLARSSLPRTSTCDDAEALLHDTLGLKNINVASPSGNNNNNNCWMESSVDKLVILVVDALRFDFAQHSFPQSFGRRLQNRNKNNNDHHHSKLLKFIADPPTVTMQRLKGLTTGGLPTFADISGNFGGAYVEEDSWMEFLRRRKTPMAFVGDDTWVDLFPHPKYWTEAHPFPSFNTRDLDTVDNGVLEFLPGLLDDLMAAKKSNANHHPKQPLDVVVAHFLGVDHVGHTYGPHTQPMAAKLQQMDTVLDAALTRLDDTGDDDDDDVCIMTLVFGDHGMTEGGNHGGGTMEEVQAALFYHTSPQCSSSSSSSVAAATTASSSESSSMLQKLVLQQEELSQIDVVPTLSLALGLPIPYANLGGLVPSLFLSNNITQTTRALALNAAQVWRYLDDYSRNANRLPNLQKLKQSLNEATSVQRALLNTNNTTTTISKEEEEEEEELLLLFMEASMKFKTFLNEATELGKHVWTRFDTTGMIIGGTILGMVLLHALYLAINIASNNKKKNNKNRKECSSSLLLLLRNIKLEEVLTIVFSIFSCCLLPFSNSYIEHEQSISIYGLSVICLAIVADTKRQQQRRRGVVTMKILLIPLASRGHELFISGHGLDPSISNEHLAHHSFVFVSSLVFLGYVRTTILLLQRRRRQEQQKQQNANNNSRSHSTNFHYWTDLLILLLLALSWWEKRDVDPTRNGYICCALALILWVMSTIITRILLLLQRLLLRQHDDYSSSLSSSLLLLLYQFGIGLMIVTGPSTAASMVFFSIQVYAFLQLETKDNDNTTTTTKIAPFVKAFLWRLSIRHLFFATNHACAFNRLQYSAAFVATEEFNFITGGASLAWNTFGYEVMGLLLLWINMPMSSSTTCCCCSQWYGMYQLLETFFSVVSVSILRRHLMVWAVFAPRFIFSSIFLCFHCISQLLLTIIV